MKLSHKLLFSLLFISFLAASSGIDVYAKNYWFGDEGKTVPDFNAYPSSKEKKDAFFSYMAHFSSIANDEVLQERDEIQKLKNLYSKNQSLSNRQTKWLAATAKKYKVTSWNIQNQNDWDALLAKVDIVPSSMLLAQSANETAWGTSRFAREGNNMFGQWCFTKGCGLVPERRNEGSIHEVRKFPTVLASVEAYIYNLNTNASYQLFRDERAELRKEGKPISGYELADGLKNYSQLGMQYVASIRGLISANQLSKYQTSTG